LDKYSITINVFGRQFPAKVDQEEAAVIREASQAINAKIKAFKAQYKTQDDLDIAIMCCLDIMTEHLTHKAKAREEVESFLQQMSQLESKLDETLRLGEGV
jgi:cell division protein ZapA (FtsZ GTPase activity inhibitor)